MQKLSLRTQNWGPVWILGTLRRAVKRATGAGNAPSKPVRRLRKARETYEIEASHRCDRRRGVRRVDGASSLRAWGQGHAARRLGSGEFAGFVGRGDANPTRHVWAGSALHGVGGPRAQVVAEV